MSQGVIENVQEKLKSATVSTALTAYGYYGWIAPRSTKLISAYSDGHVIVPFLLGNDGWYVVRFGTSGYSGGDTITVTYWYLP